MTISFTPCTIGYGEKVACLGRCALRPPPYILRYTTGYPYVEYQILLPHIPGAVQGARRPHTSPTLNVSRRNNRHGCSWFAGLCTLFKYRVLIETNNCRFPPSYHTALTDREAWIGEYEMDCAIARFRLVSPIYSVQ